MSLKYLLYILYVSGMVFIGLASISYVADHTRVIGPFALMIGMTPLVLIFEYNIPVPAYASIVGLWLSAVSGFLLRGQFGLPPFRVLARAILIIVVCLSVVGFLIFMVASVYYDVGFMAGPLGPPAWEDWVRLAARVGELGIVIFIVGLIVNWLSRAGKALILEEDVVAG